MVSFETSDLKKIGKGLTAFGVIFTLVGLMIFFHKGFIAIGNILLMLGVFLIVGPNSTLQFFLKPQNAKGTVALVVGFFLIIMGWPIIGMFMETYGFVFLFRGFWLTIGNFLRKLPLLASLLDYCHQRMYYSRPKGRRVPV